MNELRNDINEVFARQQNQLGDVSEVGGRMLRAATSARRVNRQLRSAVVGVAVVLIAGSAVAVSVVIRNQHPINIVVSHPKPTPIATPNATPVVTPILQELSVPSTTPVILFGDPADLQVQIDGITWDGSAIGRVSDASDFHFHQNPTGTLYAGSRDIRDRSGAIVARTLDWSFGAAWADDGLHYCTLVSKSVAPPAGGEPATLQLTAVGQAPRKVVDIGRRYDQLGARVAACSIEKDRAVVIESNSLYVTDQLWVVQLSTGRILWTRKTSGDIFSSHDAQYIAEINYGKTESPQPGPNATTTIYSPNGAVIGHLPGQVRAFSWDGSLAVRMADDAGPVSIVRWRDGTVLWTDTTSGRYSGALPEPRGQRIAVTITAPWTTGNYNPRNVYVIGPDGQAIKLLTNVR